MLQVMKDQPGHKRFVELKRKRVAIPENCRRHHPQPACVCKACERAREEYQPPVPLAPSR